MRPALIQGRAWVVRKFSRRVILAWAGAAAVLLASALWYNQRAEVVGHIALRSWDGEVSVPQPARAMVYPKRTLVRGLRERLAAWPDALAQVEEDHAAAMRLWRDKSAAREDALRVLQVAERSNATDLQACRDRHDNALREANDAFAELERRAKRLEQMTDPASLLEDLPGAVRTAEVGADGRFALAARVGQSPVVLVLAGDAEEIQAWLRPLGVLWAGRVEMRFSNADLLTMEALREFAGLPVTP